MAKTNVGKPNYKKPKVTAARKTVDIQVGGRTRQILYWSPATILFSSGWPV